MNMVYKFAEIRLICRKCPLKIFFESYTIKKQRVAILRKSSCRIAAPFCV